MALLKRLPFTLVLFAWSCFQIRIEVLRYIFSPSGFLYFTIFFKLLRPSLTQVPIGFALELSYLPGPAVRVSRLIFDYYRPSSETSTALFRSWYYLMFLPGKYWYHAGIASDHTKLLGFFDTKTNINLYIQGFPTWYPPNTGLKHSWYSIDFSHTTQEWMVSTL